MPERTKPRRDGRARIGSFGGTGGTCDTGDAWARVRREIGQVARQTTEQVQHLKQRQADDVQVDELVFGAQPRGQRARNQGHGFQLPSLQLPCGVIDWTSVAQLCAPTIKMPLTMAAAISPRPRIAMCSLTGLRL